jgi:hypothetical protein
MSHGGTFFDVSLGTLPRQCPDPGDVARPLGDTDGSACIEQIKRM